MWTYTKFDIVIAILSQSSIVSKRLKLVLEVFHCLRAPIIQVLSELNHTSNSVTLTRALNTSAVNKFEELTNKSESQART